MSVLTLAAQDVRPNDRLFNQGASRGFCPWVRVLSVEHTESGWTVIKTIYWSTWKHPREGVAVERMAP